MNLHEVPSVIRRAVRTGVNIHLIGEPGIGKTAIIEQTVAQIRQTNKNFGFWSLYTPALSPVDFSVPMPDTATGTLRMFHNERLPNAFDTPDLEGIVFLGERDNADPATNKALQKYINNEDMGGLKKPAGVIVISDSNDITHRSGAVQQSLALLSRSRTLTVSIDPEITLKYFADISLNPFVQAYLSLRKEHVSTFDKLMVSRSYGVWANPRAWERVGRGMDDAETNGEQMTLEEIVGDLGEGVGREFIQFLHAARDLVSYEEIITKPKTAAKPDKLSDVYAIIAMLATTVKPEDMAPIRQYVGRYTVEVVVLFMRLMVSSKTPRSEKCTHTATYREWFSDPALREALKG
jgi:hypothetical protein